MAMSEIAKKQSMAVRELADKLHEEIIADILTRLPVKSVGRFRCVSKHWCSLLSDPIFIKAHLSFHSHKHEQVKLILVTGDSSSLHTVSFNPNPQSGIDAISTKLNFKEKWERVVGSCNGLVLVLNEEDDIFLVNPTTLECRRIPNSPLALPNRGGTTSTHALGYDIVTDDYKVITLSNHRNVTEGDLYSTSVDVYTLRTGCWRRLESLFHHSLIPINGFAIFLNGALHWLAGEYFGFASAIVAFDLSDEKFFELPMPTSLDEDHMHFYNFLALRGCLHLLSNSRCEYQFDLWMMEEYGVAESWNKFSVERKTFGFTPSDDDIVLNAPGKEKPIIYNKKGKQWRDMNIDRIIAKFIWTRTFMESLVSPLIGEGTEGDSIS